MSNVSLIDGHIDGAERCVICGRDILEGGQYCLICGYKAERKQTISQNKALESAKIVVEFCKQQRSCQNCIFRLHGADHWKCHIEAFDLQDVLRNIQAKKKNHGFI